MKPIFKYIVCAAALYAVGGCSFKEEPLQQRLNEISQRIEALKGRIESQNEQIRSLSELLSGNVVTSMQEVSGSYIISYLDANGVEKTVTLATEDQMINAPILGVRKDEAGVYYWTLTAGGVTTDLLDDALNPVPVAGTAPVLSVDSDGHWTVDGKVINYPDLTPVVADDGSSAPIKGVKTDSDGNLAITLSDGQTVTIPVQQALNLKLDCPVSNIVVDLSKAFDITYEATGTSAASAIVDIADVQSLEAVIDRQTGKVSVTFPTDFQSGRLVLFAYDLKNTVIRPLFFEKAAQTSITIRDAASLIQFAERVNAQDGAEKMEVILEADIDLGGIGWTPAGNGTVTTAGIVTGAAFKGSFKGQGHTVDNFKVNVESGAADGTAAGLFGILDGASVSGLNIGSKVSITCASAKTAHCGTVAGFALNSTVENCCNFGSVSITAASDNVREVAGGILASLYTTADAQTLVKGCVNNGNVTSVNTVNSKNGATGLSVGGIVGFSDGKAYNLIENCTNNADISAQATRLAGICASANTYTKVVKCTNSGNISDTDVTASNSRVAGICSAASTETFFTDCVNMGNISFAVGSDSSHGYAAGILGQANNPLSIEGCENYGTVLSDMYKASTIYMGIIAANLNGKAVTVKGCKLGGKIGPYTEDDTYKLVTLTETNYAEYLTLASSKAGSAILQDNTFAGSAPTGIMTLNDLKEFRDSVNAGKSYNKFKSQDGSVKLLSDIDMSSVTSWEPIGNPTTCDIATNYAMSCSGNVFTGVFDGNSHAIKNFSLTVDIPSGKVFGLFGAVVGGTVRNLTMGQSGDTAPLKVTSEGLAAASVLAAVVINGSIVDCVNYIPFEFGGSRTDNVRVTCGMFAGIINATSDTGSGLSGLTNYASADVNAGSNTKNGATGAHFGGIAGFSTGTQNSTTHLNTIENCTNYGDIKAKVGRSSGIAAAAPSNTIMRYCVNRGNQVNDFTNARVGNMTCIMGVRGVMDDCTNYGNITTSESTTTAGAMIALINDASVVMTGGANYGTIICANSQYHGLMVANVSKCASIDGFHVDGACGTYSADGNHIMHEITQSNWMSHIGYINASYTSKVTNLTSKWGDAPTGELPDLKDAKLRILFIGNSFTKDAVEHLPGMLGAAGVTDVTLAHCYYGGRLVPEYNNGWKTTSDYTLYYKNPGESAWTTHSSKVNLEKVTQSGRWDIITIQEHTGNKVAWSWDATEKAAVQGLLDKCLATQSAAPKTYYILSQVYYNMAKIGTASQPYITWTDQAGMYDVLIAQGKKVKAETTYTDILSTCTYFQNLRTSKINVDNGMGLTRDGYHMDYGISRYGAACLMFESLITPVFKVTMDSNSYRYTNSSTSTTAYSTPTTNENIPYALRAARYAMEKPFEITDMSNE